MLAKIEITEHRSQKEKEKVEVNNGFCFFGFSSPDLSTKRETANAGSSRKFMYEGDPTVKKESKLAFFA